MTQEKTLKMEKTKFYKFDQNNTGGSFVVNKKLTHNVIVEAKSIKEATQIGKRMGIYFNGCDDDIDCPCCGDRWSYPDEVNLQYGIFTKKQAISVSEQYKGEVVKTVLKANGDRDSDFIFANIEEYAKYITDNYGWKMEKNFPSTRIFYLDGSIKEFYL